MKRILFAVMLCIVVMCGGAWGAYHDEGNDGNSWETAYVIDSVEDFRDMVSNDYPQSVTRVGTKYYKLTVDLDLTSDVNWENGSLAGQFDGQNHTITVNINKASSYTSADVPSVYIGSLFMVVWGTVKNLNIEGKVKGAEASGLASANLGTIENVSFNGTIEATQGRAGGLIVGTADRDRGSSYGYITNCSVSGKVSSPYSAGGIIASIYSGCSIENCTVEANTDIAGGVYSGGIAGTIERSMQNRYIKNCTTSGVTLSSGAYRGGIVGCSSFDIDANLSGNAWPDIYPQVGYKPYSAPSVPTSQDTPVNISPSSTTSWNSHKYTLFNEGMTWDEAKAYCESLGGHLATITSQEEQDAVEVLVILSGDKNSYWLGSQQDASGTWSWIDGSTWDYTHWATGQPDGDADDVRLMMYRLSNPLVPSEPGTWNDIQPNGIHGTEEFFGTENFGFICEWEPVEAIFAPLNPEYLKYLENPSAYFDDSEFYGELPDPVNLSHLDNNPPIVSGFSNSFYTADTLPAKYDPRNSGKMPPVRDQGAYGTCWSFASLGAMEASYLAQNLGTSAPNLSELHQAWFAYKDPRPGYSFELGKAAFGEHPVLDQGGNLTMSLAFLSRAGTATEDDLQYSKAADVERLTEGKLPEDYSNPLRLKDVNTVGSITTNNRDEVKHLIMSHGGLRASMFYDGSGFIRQHILL